MYLYGAGGHSNVVKDVLMSNDIPIDGMFDDDQFKVNAAGTKIDKGVQLDGQKSFFSLKSPLIICIGNNVSRALIAQKLNVEYGKAVHPSAIVASNVEIGEGTVVLHGSIIQWGAKIGKHVLINTGASVDHDNVLGDYVHISPKVALCGHVKVGEGTHIGVGAVVIPKIKIGKWCIVGAGAVVIRDVPDFSVVVGNPARVLVNKSKDYKKCHVFNTETLPDLVSQ